jgi:HAUS augmin-like complex subunit 1
MPTPLSPGSTFSPSKARQQVAQARDWNDVDSWLTAKFGRRSAPAFERNPETLKILLSLAACNEAADEETELLSRLETQAITSLQAEHDKEREHDLLAALEESLTAEGREALGVLSEASVALGNVVPDRLRYD